MKEPKTKELLFGGCFAAGSIVFFLLGLALQIGLTVAVLYAASWGLDKLGWSWPLSLFGG